MPSSPSYVAKQAQYFALLIDGNRAVLPGGEIKPTDLGVCKGSGRGDRRINDSSTDATGKQWSSRSLMKCYDEGSERFGWSKRSPRPGSMRHGDWLILWGCASAVYPTHVGAAAARLRLMANGKARVQIAAHDIGTRAYTVIGQIAAEQLGNPLSSVSVELGDSNLPGCRSDDLGDFFCVTRSNRDRTAQRALRQ